jgi:5-methylphenazine-1-carboxylate 1-monooxygenase
MQVAIIGGGIAGLCLALNLKRRNIPCIVYEAVPEVKEVGVGITLLPHAMRELSELGLADGLAAVAIENRESCFFNRFGQLLYREPRGKFAGYRYPEYGIHRGKLHAILFRAARARLGAEHILTGLRCVGIEQDAGGVSVRLQDTASGRAVALARADVAIACDGINSTVRRQFYPDETAAFSGINTWRGVTRREPILTGRSYLRIGSINTGKIVIYPIVDNVDGEGRQLINWMAEIRRDTNERNDWNKPGRREDVLPIYREWNYDWLDVAALIRDAETILEYPMVDKDPVARWTFGRVTFAGDAAHPMYPRGSNGAAQGAIDARVLADCLAHGPAPAEALAEYEKLRLAPTARIVETNRKHPPDFINIKVEELTGDRPFRDLDDFISQDELRALSDNYKKIAGFSLEDLR